MLSASPVRPSGARSAAAASIATRKAASPTPRTARTAMNGSRVVTASVAAVPIAVSSAPATSSGRKARTVRDPADEGTGGQRRQAVQPDRDPELRAVRPDLVPGEPRRDRQDDSARDEE